MYEYLEKSGLGLQPYPTGTWTLTALLSATFNSSLVRRNGASGSFFPFLPKGRQPHSSDKY